MSKGFNYTPEIKQFILDNYYKRTRRELTEMINEKFGTDFKVVTIKCYCERNNLKNGLDGKFKKGQECHNKGKKMPPEVYEKVKSTFFKPGHIPQHSVPIGTETVDSNGYYKVKISESPSVWKRKHLVIWEKAYGPVPKNSRIIFLDGDKSNCQLSNLKMITNQAGLYINQRNLNYNDALLNDIASNMAELEVKKLEVIKKRKERKNGNDKS